MDMAFLWVAIGLLSVANLALLMVVAGLRQALRQQAEAREEWWGGYPSALDEIDRAHRVIESQRQAHEELQKAFMRLTGRAA